VPTQLKRSPARVVRSGLAAAIMAAAPAPNVNAQWAVVNLHPTGAAGSCAFDVDGDVQVGYATLGGVPHGSLWRATAASWVDLTPLGATTSNCGGVHGVQQAGYSVTGGVARAGLWTGQPGSWTDNLHPAGADFSVATELGDAQVVGRVSMGGVIRASLWNPGSPWIDLHPTGATFSQASGVAGGQQVGSAQFPGLPLRAGLWTGTAASWVDLHPAAAGGASSLAVDVDGGQQVGFAFVGQGYRASLWTGTASSWVDLHPAGAFLSEAHGVHDGQQVGRATFSLPNDPYHAILWSGTAASSVDLHAFLPPGFTRSEAWGISHSGGSTYVVGSGFNGATGRTEALMWVRTVPCDANCDNSTAQPVLNVQDFTCFLQRYAAGESYANCDSSTTAPVLNVQDFTCFLQRYAAGCP
jgi:hypothetical protein